MLECLLGSVKFTGLMAEFPMGALLGGFFGLGIMAFTRRLYGVLWMQLGMAIVAGLLRFWAPIGACVVCSALAIMAEGLVFELIFNRPVFNITASGGRDLRNPWTLAFLGIIAGFAIYTVGYMFTQVFTPIVAPPHIFTPANFVAVLPLILGRGFFAALFGGLALPVAVLAKHIHLNINEMPGKHYFAIATAVTAFAWISVLAYFHL
ncbi:MAG: hypothetical protein AYK23_04650 [Candidatus Proteinoplasmatales archaeon SG8-5]|nr:MAG: hypothetical protein AYK23_04650 [Candidatus Proteinoplasmatales archaeon SG8-5]